MNLTVLSNLEEDLLNDDLKRAFNTMVDLFGVLKEESLEDQTRLQLSRLLALETKFNSGGIDFDNPTINQIRLSGLSLRRELAKVLTRKNISDDNQLEQLLHTAKNLISLPETNLPDANLPFPVSIGKIEDSNVNFAKVIHQQIRFNKKKE